MTASRIGSASGASRIMPCGRPGYPLFLAACRLAFGPSLLAVRLVQAVVGTVAVWLVGELARATVGEGERGDGRSP